MRVLITGNGTAGSWKIRGEQLGQAIGATVRAPASDSDIAAADVVVVVKRLTLDLSLRVRAARKFLVWDIVDAWPQPGGNAWTVDEARRWLRQQIREFRPDAVVYATRAMQRDGAELPHLVLEHHARQGQALNPIRDRVQLVGYEGREEYLGNWRQAIERQCASRGWRFVVNPPQLADLDILTAFRGNQWDGYTPRHWKSNVKLANAQATGTPFVGMQEAGYLDTATGAEYWASSERGIAVAFDWLRSREARASASAKLLTADVSLESIARRYREWLHTVYAQKS